MNFADEDVFSGFRVSKINERWRRFTCRQCGWRWDASDLARNSDVAPRLRLHRQLGSNDTDGGWDGWKSDDGQ